MRGYTIFNGSEIIETGQVDMTWDQIRAMRDQELDETDWRAVSDRTISQDWIDHRQALRDLPQDFPESANDAAVNFPQPPE